MNEWTNTNISNAPKPPVSRAQKHCISNQVYSRLPIIMPFSQSTKSIWDEKAWPKYKVFIFSEMTVGIQMFFWRFYLSLIVSPSLTSVSHTESVIIMDFLSWLFIDTALRMPFSQSTTALTLWTRPPSILGGGGGGPKDVSLSRPPSAWSILGCRVYFLVFFLWSGNHGGSLVFGDTSLFLFWLCMDSTS